MGTGAARPSKGFIFFCLLFGVALGFVSAAIAMSFWSLFAGEAAHRGLFILLWMLASGVFFAWPMQIVARAHANRRQRLIMRERIGDLDYEPASFPFVRTRSSGFRDKRDQTEGIAIKAPDIGESGFSTFLSGGRTADQRMADYLRSLELEEEIREAQRSKNERPQPPE